MAEIREFKSKAERFSDWKTEVFKNFEEADNAVFLTLDKQGVKIGYYNATAQDLAYLKAHLEIEILHKYLLANMDRYIEYVE